MGLTRAGSTRCPRTGRRVRTRAKRGAAESSRAVIGGAREGGTNNRPRNARTGRGTGPTAPGRTRYQKSGAKTSR
jgi:hypothetical protein